MARCEMKQFKPLTETERYLRRSRHFVKFQADFSLRITADSFWALLFNQRGINNKLMYPFIRFSVSSIQVSVFLISKKCLMRDTGTRETFESYLGILVWTPYV